MCFRQLLGTKPGTLHFFQETRDTTVAVDRYGTCGHREELPGLCFLLSYHILESKKRKREKTRRLFHRFILYFSFCSRLASGRYNSPPDPHRIRSRGSLRHSSTRLP